MKESLLKNHKILNKVTESCSNYIISIGSSGKPNKNYTPTSNELYAVKTALSISNIITCIDQLWFTVEFLSLYRKRSAPKQMNKYNYIMYVIENYYLRITSLYDRCLRLSNIVFKIGLPDKECKETTIIQNDYIKGSSVARTLKDLSRFTNKYREQRNNIAHNAKFFDEKLNFLGICYAVGEEINEFKMDYQLYDAMTDNYSNSKKQEYCEDIQELEILVDKFFNSIEDRIKEYLDKV